MANHTRNIGTNKGKRRIWLEGKELQAFGINHGMRWNVHAGINCIRIEIDPAGKRKIAGTPARPIIDMTGRTVEQAFMPEISRFEIVPVKNGIELRAVK